MFVINLDRSNDRLEHIKKKFNEQKITFQRVPAVDGTLLSEKKLSKIYDKEHCIKLIGRELLAGEIGCALSHLKAWQNIIDSKLDGAFIFEDDIVFNTTFAEVQYLQNIHSNHASLFLLSPASEKLSKPLKSLSTDNIQIYHSKKTALGCGYYINRQAAKNLISYFNLIHHPIDWWSKLRRRNIIHTYLVQHISQKSIISPLPEKKLPSTIQHNPIPSKKKKGFYNSIRRKIYNYFYFKKRLK